jgi:hypothetical protein
VASLVLGFSVLAAIAVATARETYDKPLHELDTPKKRTAILASSGSQSPAERPALSRERQRLDAPAN